MKSLLVSLVLASYVICLRAQIPYSQIEGRLEVYLSQDTTSLFIGKNTGPDSFYLWGNQNTFVGSQSGSNHSYGSGNSFFGHNSGLLQESGSNNSFFGQKSGYSNKYGSDNSFFGQAAGSSNTEGEDNSFFGQGAGTSNTEGNANSFFGKEAGSRNIVGEANSFFGYQAGMNNTDGNDNSFFGLEAGQENTIGEANSFFGESAGKDNTQGSKNSFFGKDAGDENVLGNENSFFGYRSGHNSKGFIVNPFTMDTVLINYNSFYGARAGNSNQTGEKNTFIGAYAGYSNVGGKIVEADEGGYEFDGGGSDNIFIGDQAGYSNISGQDNIYIGNSSARDNVDGDRNIVIGHFSSDGITGNDNVIIGEGPPEEDTINSRLYIGDSNEGLLIYGEFDNHFMRVNGDLDIGSNSKEHISIEDATIQAKNGATTEDLYLNEKGGKVAIGDPSSFSDKLHINASDGEGALRVQVDGTTRLRVRSSGSITLGSNPQAVDLGVVYIDEDYKLGVGVLTPRSTVDIEGLLQLQPREEVVRECDQKEELGRVMYNSLTQKLQVCTDSDPSTLIIEPGWVPLH